MKKIYFILILFIITLPAIAGDVVYPENIKYSFKAQQAGNTLNLQIEIIMDNVHIPGQGMLVLTPVIMTEEHAEYHLAPAVIAGSKRYKAIERLLAYDNPVFRQTPQALIKKKGSRQTISLSYLIPYEKWMHGADMYIYGDASGCVNCDNVFDKQLVGNDIVPPLPSVFIPEYHVSYIVPEAEIKERSETFVARINYVVNRYELLPDFKNNATVLKDVDNLIKELQSDPDLTVTRHTVTGYASPEGSFSSNLTLSQNRAKSFMDYLRQKYNWNTVNISHEGKGEDWSGLRKAVLDIPGLPHRNEIISIIDNTSDIARRKQALQTFDGGSVYKRLLNDVYPSLRRNEFTVSYIARAFNVDEARRIIRTRPQLLNLNEMFLVANSYPKDSKEFKEVFDIAVRMFPNNDISKVNAAATDIETGSAGRAIERLTGIETAEAWNNLGIAYAQQGNFELARQYFQRAARAKNTEAVHNLDQLNKKEESQR